MNQRNCALLFVFFLFHSFGLHAQIDLIKKAGEPVLLISSFDVAKKPPNFDFTKHTTKIAKSLCHSIKKKMVSFTTTGLDIAHFDEQLGIYEASSPIISKGRISFQNGIYPLVPYSSRNTLLELEQGFFLPGDYA